ncbi:septin-2-like isoform X1 [Biomphalaria glabrata]|uniref:Septin n=1 Tax=Biomphalaria glabrata TaxID=6526 RepID=A0A9W2YH98_BIOGL|nr:septin-2-like isoform X1 [Biomphalaria glabrata]XP_055862046.1 septin-2-like isoform X1 [Biomphalaria glabrata]XP_055862047.1 septin-2-like isoform X1 [Biomphalaria glabrata]XP_055862048.1 septin-2-like isoform X1 [Biomphalaria glabrata]XP_055862049.1 septin-2-like isoform X1 [Biomphalaria glabrata]
METGRVSPMKPKRNTSKKNLVENVSEPSIGQNGITTSPVSPSGNILDSVIPATPGLKRRLTRRMIYTPAKYKDEDEYIGFATLPEQVHRKAVRKGFDFTLMVVGESGLGKSTLINSLFLSDLYKGRELPSVNDLVERTVNIEKKQLEIEEKGVRLKLTIVDTPGFNDAVNAGNSQKSLIEYVDKQFEQYYEDECGLNRRNIVDNRVHCCLYFISPYGHGLRQIDIETMKKLHHKVNIVPLLAKADILTKEELRRMKNRILEEIEENHIQIYEFPDCDSDEDEDFKQQDRELKASIPFAVVGCNTVVEAGGKKIRGRAYPWGIVEVDNPNHCDFIRLRQMLISTHMQDLKDVTSDVHYENYRALHIRTQLGTAQKERGKLKRDSAANFEALSDTEKLLEQKDAEIQRMQQMLAKMQEQLKASSPQQQHVNGLGKL